jgi:hypothetical protein
MFGFLLLHCEPTLLTSKGIVAKDPGNSDQLPTGLQGMPCSGLSKAIAVVQALTMTWLFLFSTPR